LSNSENWRFRQTPPELAGNATSRYALGWPYSGLRNWLIPAPFRAAQHGLATILKILPVHFTGGERQN